ncbi:sodium-dependent phosphate transport protein 3-like isoform X2 [Planococcus citri]|uniref:sodium-dependent phosphate transport protein 3-like isoform X2 n=1 Tax=Planococcus citri TaxID=170843 RepID=UPI0031F98BB2
MQKRNVLILMLLFLLICNSFVTMNINIAIVSMVGKSNTEGETIDQVAICPNQSFFLRDFSVTDEPSFSNTQQSNVFDWSESEQNIVLSGYYWLNYFSILPGGVLAHKYGSKIVAGYAQVIASAMSSLIPIVTVYGPLQVAWLRAIQGVLSFMAVPAALYTIVGKWIPPQERSKFIAAFYGGSVVGMTAGNFIFGYTAHYMNWTYVFHLTTVCGIIWSIFWYIFVHDSPDLHPTITAEEKQYIESCLKEATSKTKTIIPWKSILFSAPVVASILSMNATLWVCVMLITYIPVYLKHTYGLNSNEIGIISSVPNVVVGISVLGLAYCVDLTLKKNLLSITATRKICTLTGATFASIPIIIIAFTKCNLTLVIVCLLIHYITRILLPFGAPLSMIDMSPEFCGIIEGLSGTSSSVQTFLFTWAVNYFTSNLGFEELWKMVFLYSTMYLVVASLLFLIFGTSEVQDWNYRGRSEQRKCEDVKMANLR